MAAVLPLRSIALVVVPFWFYVMASNVLSAWLSNDTTPWQDVVSRVLQYLILLPLLIGCYHFALRIGFPRKQRWRAIMLQLLLAAGFALIGRFIRWATFSLAMWDPSWMTAARMELIPELRIMGASFLALLLPYWTGLALVVGLLAFRRLRDVTLRAAQTERDYISARLQALRGQLNPHFLFNTLNSVWGLIDERPRTAKVMLIRLADLLRASLRDEGEEHISLSGEVELVRNYLEIQQLRFSDRLTFSIDVEAGLDAARVPGFILQPLAENAIKHGMADQADAVDIRIRARRHAGALELCVTNSASHPAGEVKELGVGLGNTRERLRALYGDKAGLSYEQVGSEFVVRIVLPLTLAAQPARAA